MDQAAVARRRLAAMEAWTHTLCRVATPWRRPGAGSQDRQQPTWPLATQQQPRAHHGSAKYFLRLARPGLRRGTAACIILRTAVYETRTYGGVGGAESQASPLSRFPEASRLRRCSCNAGLWNAGSPGQSRAKTSNLSRRRCFNTGTGGGYVTHVDQFLPLRIWSF